MENIDDKIGQIPTQLSMKSSSDYQNNLAELACLIRKKHDKSEKLAKLERDIYVCESVYLRTTQEFGNMIRGWDKHRFLNKNTYLRTEKLQDKFLENQRIFSKSSVTSLQFTSQMKQRPNKLNK